MREEKENLDDHGRGKFKEKESGRKEQTGGEQNSGGKEARRRKKKGRQGSGPASRRVLRDRYFYKARKLAASSTWRTRVARNSRETAEFFSVS